MLIRFYTDGSYYKDFNLGAWSFVVCEPKAINKHSGIGKNVTNNKLELKAVNEALSFAIKKKYKQIEINTDSSYVFNTIIDGKFLEWERNDWLTNSGRKIKNSEEWIKFVEHIKKLEMYKCNCTFVKVKAHSNNYLNRIADETAKLRIKKYLEECSDENKLHKENTF